MGTMLLFIIHSEDDDDDEILKIPQAAPADDMYNITTEIDDQEEKDDIGDGIVLVEDAEEFIQDTGCVAFASSLIRLANVKVPTKCLVKKCGMGFELQSHRTGTCLILDWVRTALL